MGWTAIFLLSAAFSFLVTLPLVHLLTFLNLRQTVREEGPQTHFAKAGTPTMGGLGIILTLIIFSLILIDFEIDIRYLGLLLMVIGFAAIGFVDDFLKVFRKQNLGLTFWQKIILQALCAGLFSFLLLLVGHNGTTQGILQWCGFGFMPLYFLLSTFIIVGTANATNLTDGLDGLLGGTAMAAFLAFAFLSARLHQTAAVTFSIIIAGAVLAFLYFNFPKAKVFMGDVSSLALGAALAGIAILIHKELRLVLIGGVFFIEALSVILQVTSYKLYKRRIFKMTPLHHHFELLGWSEKKVVIAFWVVGIICGVVGAGM